MQGFTQVSDDSKYTFKTSPNQKVTVNADSYKDGLTGKEDFHGSKVTIDAPSIMLPSTIKDMANKKAQDLTLTRSNSYGDFHNIPQNILMLIWTVFIYWGIVDSWSREVFIRTFGPRAPLPGHVLGKGGIWILKTVFVLSCVMLCFVFRMRENKLYFLLHFLPHY